MKNRRNRLVSIPALVLTSLYALLVASAVIYASVNGGYSWLLVAILSQPWLALFVELGIHLSMLLVVIGIIHNMLFLYVMGLVIERAFFERRA